MSSKEALMSLSNLKDRPENFSSQSKISDSVNLNSTQIESVTRKMQDFILSKHPELLAEAREDTAKRERLKAVISQGLFTEAIALQRLTRERLADEITSEIVGYGPIDQFINDSTVTEIMVNGWHSVYIERNGLIEKTNVKFRDNTHVLEIIGRIVAPVGRRIDQLNPFVDARLPNGSRINAIIPPLALNGPILTIRKFSGKVLAIEDLIDLETLNQEMAEFLELCVKAKLNVLVSGGTGSGKTTTLNVILAFVPDERIITIEDSAELNLRQSHVISLESRPPNIEGKGEVTIRQLVRNALRMRPDRLVIGEVRGAESFDMIQALCTGHSGSMSTVHANSAVDAIRRVESMAMMAGEDVPHNVLHDQVISAFDLIIHQSRLSDGSRKMMTVSLVNKPETFSFATNPDNPDNPVTDVFRLEIVGRSRGTLECRFRRTEKYKVPNWLNVKFLAAGIKPPSWMES